MPIDALGTKHEIPKGNQTSKPKINKASTAAELFTDDKNQSVKVEDFLSLMIAQLSNQDIMNPMDDTQYVTQLAQFQTLQQMQELAYNSKANFMTSLVGKEVTAARLSKAGDAIKTTGEVTKVSMVDGKFEIYIGGDEKPFTYDQIMEIKRAKDPSIKIAETVDKISKDLAGIKLDQKDNK